MSTPDFNPSAFSRLSSLTIAQAITAYEQIAQSKFDEAKKHEGCIHAVALVVRLNYEGQQNLDKAESLRAVLAIRRAKHQQKQRFVAKCLEAQALAHQVLSVKEFTKFTPIRALECE